MGTTHEEQISKVADLVDQARIAMLTTMTESGRHVSRPMGVQEVEFDGDLWFFTFDDSPKADQIRANPEVNVAFANEKDSEWTSLSGWAEVVHDREQAERLWSAPLKVWFPDGPGTDGIAQIKIHVDTAEYWDSSSSKVTQLLGAARAAVTGDPDKFPGENETVRMR